MADLRLQISSDSRRAQQDIDALRREITQLRTQLAQTQGASDTARQAVDRFGDEARQAATGVTTLGRSIFQTSEQAKRFDGVFRGVDGRLREANGRFVKGREALDDMGRSFGGASGGAQTFTRSLGGLGTILGSLGVAAVGSQLIGFGRASVSAAARLEGFERGLRLIEGTNAPQRLEELIEVANLPGLNLTDLIQYSNRLRTLGLTAAETDTLLTSTGQAITAFGGTAHTAAEATEQIIQAISSGTVSLQDFRSIAQRVPGFYQAIADVHGVSANIDGLRTAVENAGGSIKDALIPVMEELSQRFAAPPPESFAASIDALQNSFFLLQAEIGQQLLPVVGESVRALSTLFDALRENDLDALPEPIQAIVRGMQSLFDGFVSVGESIRSGLGPELDLLLPAIGNLLGDILSLAGALVEALAPAYEILAAPTRVAIALIVHLADTIGSVIGAITDFVDWVSGAAASQEELQTATAATARAIGEATEALGEGATATERFQASITDLQTELDSINTQLEAKRQRLSELAETITSKSHPSYQQLERQITTLEGEQARLTGEITKTQGSLDKQTQSTTATTAATKEAATEAQNYADILANLQKNITEAQRVETALAETQDGLNAFWRVASGEVGNLNQELATLIPSITDTAAELSALESAIEANNSVMLTAIETGRDLDVVLMQLSDGLTSIAADQAIATAEFNLVNPAISDVVDSLRDYNDVLLEAGINFRSVEDISEDLTQSIRDQASAFDDLRDAAETAEITLDDIDETFDRIPDAIDPAIISMEDFESVGLRALRSIGDELSAFEGDLGSIGIGIDNLVTLFANPINFAAGTLGAVFEGLSNINEFAGALGLPDDFFDDPVPGQAQINPQNIVQNEQLAQQQVHQAGIARNLNVADPLSQIEILRENDPGIFQRFGTREFIEQNFPELVDVIYPSGQGFNQSGALAGRRAAQSVAEATGTDRQATEDAAILMYGPEDYAAEVAAATGDALSDIPEPDLPPEIADPLGTFSLTRDEREILEPYETAVRIAENAIEDLTADSTPQEIADAYQALVFAQTNLSSITEGIIRAAEEAERITGTAATNAIDTLELDLGDDLRTANNALIGTLGDIGFEVVGGIENIREAINVSDISSVFRRIPEQIEEAAAEPELEPAPEPEAQDLQSTFSFSRDQRGILAPLVGEVTAAQDFIDNFLNEDSTPEEIEAAYQRLTDAETALFNQKVQFILLASDITDEARGRALTVEGQIFDREIREANDDLVDAFEDIGLQLVNALTFTSGILRGTALAAQQIPVEAEAAAEEAEPEADEVDPLAILRSNARLAANQVRRSRTALGQATSEQDFEDRRVNLIQAVNAAYTAQIALLDALGLSEADYQDRFEDAEDARDSAITRATTSVNTFAEARIKGEEDAAAAAQDAADEKIAAEERAERERMRIAERAARESQRIAERQQREIADLRDDALDAEADRLQSIEDLHDRHLMRVLGLELGFSRDLDDLRRDRIDDAEDLNLEYQRDLEDLQNRFTRQLVSEAISFSDLTAEQQARVTESTGFQRGRFDLNQRAGRGRQDIEIESGVLRAGSAGEAFYRQQIESGQLTDQNLIEQLFGRQGLGDFLGLQRGTEDAATHLAQGIIDATETYNVAIDANTLAVNALTMQLSSDADAELTDNPSTAEIAEITGIPAPATEMIVTGVSDAVMEGLSQPSQVDEQLAMAIAPEAMVLTADIVNINANSVNLSGDVAGGGNGGASDVNVIVEVRNSDVVLDGEKVGQMVGDVIVKQQQQGRSSLGEGS